jgi:hypothetical protein
LGFDYGKCLEIVRGNLGEGFEHLCDVKPDDLVVEKHPVVGWLVVTLNVHDERRVRVLLYPLILLSYEYGYSYREVFVDAFLTARSVPGATDSIAYEGNLPPTMKIVGALPAWPNTYHVSGFVKKVAFSLGVHVNPEDGRLRELLLETYMKWLNSNEAKLFKHKLSRQS